MSPLRPVSSAALLSFILGVLSLGPLVIVLTLWQGRILVWLAVFFCLGPLALLVGFVGLRAVNRSDGRLAGQTLAVVGMILGGLATLVLLAGLGASWVLRSRGQAYLAACQNNLRTLFLATRFYYEKQEQFPVGTIDNPNLPPEQRLSWYVRLLPYMEQDPAEPRKTRETGLYEMIDQKVAWNAPDNRKALDTPLRRLFCPAHPDSVPVVAPTYYVGLAGIGSDAARLPLASPDAGMFGYDRVVHIEDLTGDKGRGQNSTAMVAETNNRIGYWAEGGPATVRGLDIQDKPYLGVLRQFGALHPGVTNVLFAGGSVDALSDDIDPVVFQDMLRIHAAPAK